MNHPHRATRTRIAPKRWAAAFVLAVAGGVAALAGDTAGLFEPAAAAEAPDVTVYKRAHCNCCNLWVEHLRDNGLQVETVSVPDTGAVRERLGVPESLGACHTARAGDYWIEGHVPADLVLELLEEQPDDLRGLAVPGMPIGSPGMEGPNPEHYSIIGVDTEGETRVHAEREGKAKR